MDPTKIEVIKSFPPPKNVKVMRSFLGHAGFHRHFMKGFPRIAKALTKFLQKDAHFFFDPKCMRAFEALKISLILAHVVQVMDLSFTFDLRCDANDCVVGMLL